MTSIRFKANALCILFATISFTQPVFGTNPRAVQRPAGDKPNFVVVLADDLGWGDLACYGNAHIRTPELDKMAKQGIRFTHFYVNNPMCSPSRAGFLTGQYPARHRIHAWIASRKANQERDMADYLDPSAPMLPRLLRKGGYRTAHFGKWHLGHAQDAPEPKAYGFDEVQVLCQGKGPSYGVPANHPRATEMIVNSAIDFMNRHRDKPFYVQLWLRDVHARLSPSKEALARYHKVGPVLPKDIYFASVTEMDHQVGRLNEWIEAHGLARNTIVAFTSDNGPEMHLVDHANPHCVGSTGPFRGRKTSLYEGGIRMPLIIKWKGQAPENVVDNESVLAATDILPTFLGLAGILTPDGRSFDGVDISSCFKGIPIQRNQPLYWEFRYPSSSAFQIHRSPPLAIRVDEWKSLIYHDSSHIELYDVVNDPLEIDNLASEHPDIAERLKSKLLAWQKTLPVNSRPVTKESREYAWPNSLP